MRIRDILCDLLGVICLFGTGYGLFLLSYAAGF